MAVKLDFYEVNTLSGIKQPINGAYSFGKIFKGNQKRACFTVFNSGDTPAVAPVVSIKEYETPDNRYAEAVDWKRVSFTENSNYTFQLELPDIQPNSWLEGKDIYKEDFNGYPVVAGTPLDSTWMTWQNVSTTWEVYNGWLQHNVDTQDGRACWTVFPKAVDFIYSQKMTIRDGTYGGILLRHTGDYDTGYIVLLQGVYDYLEGKPSNEGILQVYAGTFSNGIKTWRKLWSSGSVGIRGTHDQFKVKLTGNKFEFWYQNNSETPNYTFIDTENLYNNPAQPVILCHAGSGSILSYFDDVYMEVKNNDGKIWVQNTVDIDAKSYRTQQTILDVSFGGDE